MLCPLCQHAFTSTTVETTDHQQIEVDECYNCGGHFLPSIVINFLSEKTAKNLDSVVPHTKDSSELTALYLHCPICNEGLSAIQDNSVPKSVTIYSCPNNHGNFFPKGQLAAFKIAQDIKLNYHKVWGIPLSSAFAIVLPLLVVLTTVSALPILVNQIRFSQENRVSANNLISKPLILNTENHDVLISFSTTSATTSSLILKSNNKESVYVVSDTPKTTHTITLKDLQTITTYTFTLKTPSSESLPYTFITSQ